MEWLNTIFGSSSGSGRRYGDEYYPSYGSDSSSSYSGTSSYGGSSSYSGSSAGWQPTFFDDPYRAPTPYSSHGGGYPYQDSGRVPDYRDSGRMPDYRDSGRVPDYQDGNRSYQSSGRSYQDDRHLYGYPMGPGYGGYPQYSEPSYAPNYAPSVAAAPSDDEDSRDYTDADSDKEVESLNRRMQETLSLRGPPPQLTSVTYNPPIMYASRYPEASTCAGCKRQLYGRSLTCLGRKWHPSCFCCSSCNRAIEDREFSVQGNMPYHRDCYKKSFHPKCEICHDFIPPNTQGLIEYRSHPFWDQKYCPVHERDGSRRCCSCDRIETVDEKNQYTSLGDGRKSCSECLESNIMDTRDCQPLYRDILKFYRNRGMPIEQEIPMLLVKRPALNNAREAEKDEHIHAPETRGLCLSEEQTITTVYETAPDEYGYLHPETEARKLTRHCEVTAILVLFGLPRLLTGSILAHELMHAWIRLDGRFPPLENEVEEGICQVIAHIWLKEELEKLNRKGTGTASTKRLGEFFLHQIETDSSPVYGDGFRAAMAAVEQYGLLNTINHLREKGRIP